MDYPITDGQVHFYQENGYVQLFDVLTPDELAEVRTALDDANRLALDARHHTSAGRPEYERVFVQKVNLWTVHEGMRRYVFSRKLAEIAHRLAQTPRVRLWHDHALIKMPGRQSRIALAPGPAVLAHERIGSALLLDGAG